jgi:hypothetical protein
MASALNTTHAAEVCLPSAAPIPRTPSFLLGSARSLLAAHGCPVCRYSAESSDAYLAWFALEGHGDADMLGRLCASRGMCGSHTRRLLSQPGAPARLTAVYRHVLKAATGDVCAPAARCPACEHDANAEDRALLTLLEDLAVADRQIYKQHGGLCLPHLRRASCQRKNYDLSWLTRYMLVRLSAHDDDLRLVAGWTDADADARAAFRAILPRRLPAGGAWLCSVCWTSANAERTQLAEASLAAGPGPDRSPGCWCGPHIRDLAVATGGSPGLLASQADLQAERLSRVLDGRPRRLGISAGWLSYRARAAFAEPDCPVCAAGDAAGRAALGHFGAALPDSRPGTGTGLALCVRHARGLRAVDAPAGRRAAAAVRDYAQSLVGELEAAGRKDTWTHRAEPRGAEMTAWRRAAAFLDGAVFGGCPAGPD